MLFNDVFFFLREVCYPAGIVQGDGMMPESVQPRSFTQPVVKEEVMQERATDDRFTIQRKPPTKEKAQVSYLLNVIQPRFPAVMGILGQSRHIREGKNRRCCIPEFHISQGSFFLRHAEKSPDNGRQQIHEHEG